MAAPPNTSDPRTTVTPRAFEVAPGLLGLPLASPGRRLAAILLDLVFIGIVTVVTRSFAFVLGIVISAALIRAAFQRTQVTDNVFDRARRASIGCLGLLVGFVTVLAATVVAIDRSTRLLDGDDPSPIAFELLGTSGDPSADERIESRDADAIRDGASLYTTQEAVEAYAALLRSGADTETDRELLLALEARLVEAVAADTLSDLRERIERLQSELQVERTLREQAEEDLERGGGFWGWLTGLVDELGFGFGWAALYTTVLMTLTNGQTLGKRMLGIRVVRLDGQRITWWVGFERAGGYAAGFATGLLGFAQVYWDANRQAIHDRIVGTVVVREGAQRVQDQEAVP